MNRVKKDFPFFTKNPDTVFLDSAASSLTPVQVTHAVERYYNDYGVNIHRGVYQASQEATQIYEDTRDTVKNFLEAEDPREIIYTRNATESLNLIAYSLADLTNPKKFSMIEGRYHAWEKGLQPNDIIILSESEHHANIVPWQMLAKKYSLEIVYIPINKTNGTLSQDGFELIKKKYKDHCVKIVSLAQVSNVSGVYHDLTPFLAYAREKGALFIVDGAQSVCHSSINLKSSDFDFFVFSAHKMLGPTGIGVLWGKLSLLECLPPFMGGGNMILSVKKEGAVYNHVPHKFEAGTPDVAGVFGLKAAIEYLESYGMQKLAESELYLTKYALQTLESAGVKIYGPSLEEVETQKVKKTGVISFNIGDIHPHDVGSILDQEKIAIRTGHHCCQILMQSWNTPATCRASLYLYNIKEDIDQLIKAIHEVKKVFKPYLSQKKR